MNLVFLFSSITFLQYYIPIVIEANNNNIKSIFYIRKNKKNYANVYNANNMKIFLSYKKQYNIIVKDLKDLKDETGIIIMVDGDIYGPPNKYSQYSLLNKLNQESIKISLQEHLNFNWSYEYYIDKVDYCIFPNIKYAELYNKISDKNVYLGNTKYDHILPSKKIYNKYKLNPKNKYALVLFPKEKFIKNYNIKPIHIINIYNYLHQMGFKIIVKSRPKDSVFKECKGDNCFISDIFPNESLELMKISELCILFSSSAIEETIMMEIPTIDFLVDNEIERRLEFLCKDNTIQLIKNWKNLKLKVFTETIRRLAPKNSKIYKELKNDYLFEGPISKKILDFINNNLKFLL